RNEITERARAEAAEHKLRVLAEALSEVTAALTSTLDLDEVLEGILANVGFVVPHDAANVMLIEDPGVARLVYCRGYAEYTSETAVLARRYVIEETPNQRQMLATGWPVVIPDTHADESWLDIPEARWVRSYAGSPIILGAKVIGFINLDSSIPGFFTPEHGTRLRAFADHAAIALENARLHNEAKYLSVMEERGRLANELHDAVSQMLFSASLIADVLPVLWERDAEMGRESLVDLRRLTRGALAEMRALLLEMRPHALERADLSDMLRQLAESVAGRTGVDINLTIEARHPLPVDVRIALYRIAQEALNNVARHAGADRVTVALCECDSAVTLSIMDNGRGFDPDDIPAGHFGLSIMQERAEKVGAAFEAASRPGQGAQIRVTWERR
ncbi:MAG: GAF domain-containing sensor histidine kinase, partial [Anaerolineae bacterium]|nr:GAF domain-containing sensor histidine kinase [Anaerolineae bacterium]